MINDCIDNFINGNLSDAKRQATRLTKIGLYKRMRSLYGWSHAKAFTAAHYLKNPSQVTFQAACDAK